jgi:hypothetical protein
MFAGEGLQALRAIARQPCFPVRMKGVSVPEKHGYE